MPFSVTFDPTTREMLDDLAAHKRGPGESHIDAEYQVRAAVDEYLTKHVPVLEKIANKKLAAETARLRDLCRSSEALLRESRES
jgi:hypothetical protein